MDRDRIGCDGGGGALGHPLVYLTMDNSGKVDCPYCGRRYIRGFGGKSDDAH
ncbi:MAG TPA: zinc-finger domain-containing protein [Candidatus Polarisedimenticolia bacterium]|nr:zinc-finger domain-containing protein [Candidatus Polarisedimenticolia bacterium]